MQNTAPADKKATLLAFDTVLGFGLAQLVRDVIPDDVQQLADERENARKNKDFSESDRLRDAMSARGYIVKDTADGPEITKQF